MAMCCEQLQTAWNAATRANIQGHIVNGGERALERARQLYALVLSSVTEIISRILIIYIFIFSFVTALTTDVGRAWAWQYVRVSFFPSSLFSFFSFFYYLFLIAFDALSISSDAKFTFEQRMKHKRVEKCEIQLSNIYGVHEQSQGFDVGALQWYGCAWCVRSFPNTLTCTLWDYGLLFLGHLVCSKKRNYEFWLQLNSFKTTLIRGFRSFFHLLFSQPSTKSRRFAPFVCRARALLLLLLFGLSCLVSISFLFLWVVCRTSEWVKYSLWTTNIHSHTPQAVSGKRPSLKWWVNRVSFEFVESRLAKLDVSCYFVFHSIHRHPLRGAEHHNESDEQHFCYYFFFSYFLLRISCSNRKWKIVQGKMREVPPIQNLFHVWGEISEKFSFHNFSVCNFSSFFVFHSSSVLFHFSFLSTNLLLHYVYVKAS